MGASLRPPADPQNAKSALPNKNHAQRAKIEAIRDVLFTHGLRRLGDQAWALGLGRSTAWHLLSAGHKHGGVTASVINKMLASENLPAAVRLEIEDYVRRKLSGEYGHSVKARIRFKTGLCNAVDQGRRQGQPRFVPLSKK